MQNKRTYILLGIVVLRVDIAAFVAGKWINRGPSSEDRVSNVTPAPEIPTSTPELYSLLVEKQDNLILIQSVSFNAGTGWRLGDASEPMDASSGPKVEVLVTGDTIIYRDDFEFNESSIQQRVEKTTLDDLNSQMMITVWGRNAGDRVIADVILAQHLK